MKKKFSIFNFQFSNRWFTLSVAKGFTLLELLVIIGVFITVGGLVVGILVITLRDSNKTSVLTTVRQNGDFAITQMSKIIRNARSLDPATVCSVTGTSASSITLTSSDLQTITFSCLGSTIASNGATLLDTLSVTTSSCSFTCTQASPSEFPVIGISFSLSQVGAVNFVEQKASASAIPFQTSVELRNVSR